MNYKFKASIKELLADTTTPLSLYMKLREQHVESILLESSDHASMNSHYSFIAIDPIAKCKVNNNKMKLEYPDGIENESNISDNQTVISQINQFFNLFSIESDAKVTDQTFGLFGYFNYESVRYFEQINIHQINNESPTLQLALYKHVLVFNHLKNTLQIVSHYLETEDIPSIDALLTVFRFDAIPTYPFKLAGEESSDNTDEQFLATVQEGKTHCHKGNVFQIVLSRRFQQKYTGDDFNVYRQLRSLNPSPYLFYCDYGSHRIFGSSPEVQVKYEKGVASIHPIAGTYKRTGNDDQDLILANELRNDPKENAEHTMLVDLARNDLSKDFLQVKVKVDKALEFFSHVIHIVSEVEAAQPKQSKLAVLDVVAHTFPAGTLSGAPKYKAMQLIDNLENSPRGFYGGCVGFIGFNQSVNMAIMIRSFYSEQQTLTYRAGAGVVAASKPENELQEVHNKLAALRKALDKANNFNESNY